MRWKEWKNYAIAVFLGSFCVHSFCEQGEREKNNIVFFFVIMTFVSFRHFSLHSFSFFHWFYLFVLMKFSTNNFSSFSARHCLSCFGEINLFDFSSSVICLMIALRYFFQCWMNQIKGGREDTRIEWAKRRKRLIGSATVISRLSKGEKLSIVIDIIARNTLRQENRKKKKKSESY